MKLKCLCDNQRPRPRNQKSFCKTKYWPVLPTKGLIELSWNGSPEKVPVTWFLGFLLLVQTVRKNLGGIGLVITRTGFSWPNFRIGSSESKQHPPPDNAPTAHPVTFLHMWTLPPMSTSTFLAPCMVGVFKSAFLLPSVSAGPLHHSNSLSSSKFGSKLTSPLSGPSKFWSFTFSELSPGLYTQLTWNN